MGDLEVMNLLAVTTINLRYEDFRGHISFLYTLHGGSYVNKQRRAPGWGTIGLQFDLGRSLPYAVLGKGDG